MNENDSHRDLLIALALIPWLTPARSRLLRQYFEPLGAACHAPATFLTSLLNIDESQLSDLRDPFRGRDVTALRDCSVTLDDEDYPPLLREIIDPPLALFYRGNLSLAHNPLLVAIVGSRRASPYATNAASHLATTLGRSGITIVSGLARGVDAAAHQAALDSAAPTIAVLGTGIDIVYPKAHRRLFRAIEERGLIVSEFPNGTPPLPPNFPIRNRVISGLTHGTLVVEATTRSGSLITARTAAEQGREVFAVPGSIFSAGSEGTHRLIQYGAKLVHDADDVLQELPGHPQLAATGAVERPNEVLAEVLAAFTKEDGLHIDSAAARLNRSTASLAEPLLQLEIDGFLKALPGGRYVRVK